MATQGQQEPIAVYRQALLANKREEAVVQSCRCFSPLFFFFSFGGGTDGATGRTRLTVARPPPPAL